MFSWSSQNSKSIYLNILTWQISEVASLFGKKGDRESKGFPITCQQAQSQGVKLWPSQRCRPQGSLLQKVLLSVKIQPNGKRKKKRE